MQHKPPIVNADLKKKVYESAVFNTDSPKTLFNKVFFEIMLCFFRRGRQNLRHAVKEVLTLLLWLMHRGKGL